MDSELRKALEQGLDRIVRHLAEASFEDIPQETIQRAKLVLADTFGCILSGRHEKAAAAMHGQTLSWGGAPQASMWGFRTKAPFPMAACVNALCARANDYGPVETCAGGKFKPMHISESTVPAALAAAEHLGASGKDLITALIVGEDLAGRLSGSMDLPLPLDCRGTLNTMSAAVIYGKLAGFGPDEFRHALGLALHGLNGIKQGTHFQLSQGTSAQNGLIAAELAARGLKGVDDPALEILRLYEIFVKNFDPEALMERLGKEFYSTTTFKPYPACRATHAAIECALDIASREGFDAGEITDILLTVSPWTMKHPVARPFCVRNYAHADAIYSIQYVTAVALLYQRIGLEHLTEEAATGEAIAALASKVRLTSEGWPLHPDDTFLATGMEVKVADRTFRTCVTLPKGNAIFGRGLSQEDIRQKFMDNAAFSDTLTPGDAQAVWDFFSTLEQQPDLSALSAIFTQGTKQP